MGSKQLKLCMEVLRRLNKAGVLKNVLLIGSWCVPFYKEYFSGLKYATAIRTRDMDLLIPFPAKLRKKVDIPELLKDLGFVTGFRGRDGYIKLEHPELIIEFLVPEKGRTRTKPYPLPKLGLNAQALRFLNYLAQSSVKAPIGDISVNLPHPAYFALHKLIISPRRRNKEKSEKDRKMAVSILKSLIRKNEEGSVRQAFDSAPQKWQKKILAELRKTREKDILEILP
ncbi:MAG: hypothetical protein GF392_00785 [Candidatus Omnitrophica bacterium]|nr:hypothetical protein [Candidatus Omnitrophota bacterium]